MNDEDFAPCALDEHDGVFSLTYFEFDENFWKLTEPHDGQGGGYSMEAMVQAALDIEGKTVADVDFDSEGDAFHIRGGKASLKTVADIIRRFMVDPAYAEKAILHAESGGYFE